METWKQERQTKLGLATIEIVQVQDLYEATVSLVNGIDAMFIVTETFGDARCAFHWAYGVKQALNDDWSGYKRQGDNLVESKPAKGKTANIIPIESAIKSVIEDYNQFVLGRTASSKGDTISVSEVKSSTLSQDDQATLLNLMARAKVKVVNE